MEKITIKTEVKGDVDNVWEAWNNPAHIKNWYYASDDWQCTKAVNDFTEGGRFSYTLSAADNSESFDFEGTYTNIEPLKLIEFKLDDERLVQVEFKEYDGKVTIIETFESEEQNPIELQKTGWQAILDNFAKYFDSLSN